MVLRQYHSSIKALLNSERFLRGRWRTAIARLKHRRHGLWLGNVAGNSLLWISYTSCYSSTSPMWTRLIIHKNEMGCTVTLNNITLGSKISALYLTVTGVTEWMMCRSVQTSNFSLAQSKKPSSPYWCTSMMLEG